MPAKLPITILLAAKNEERNIGKCLAALTPAERVVLLDSHSRDATARIAAEHGAEVVQFDYQGGYPKKRQWALSSLDIRTPWTFLLDADEVVPDALWREIETAIARPAGPDAYFITKGFHFLGKRFRFGGFSFAAVLLFRTGKARFEHLINEPPGALDMEVHERLIVNGTIGALAVPLIHDDWKNLEAYIDRHNKYSTWEAHVRHQFARTGQWGSDSIRPRLLGNPQERRRFLKQIVHRLPCEPWLWFINHFFFRLGFLEGRAGFIASQIRASYIAQVRAKLYELRRNESTPHD